MLNFEEKNIGSQYFHNDSILFAFNILGWCLVSGMNSILLYVGHELLMHCFPVQFWVPETHAARLSMELWGAILWAAVAFCLHRSGVYLAI